MIAIIITFLLLQLLTCSCNSDIKKNNHDDDGLSLSGGYNNHNVINIEAFNNNVHDDDDDDDDDLIKQCTSNNITMGNKRTSYYKKSSKRRYQSLICWLYNLKLNIPDEHFRSGFFSVVSFVFIYYTHTVLISSEIENYVTHSSI